MCSSQQAMSCCEPDPRNSLAEVNFTVGGQRQLRGTPQRLQTTTGSWFRIVVPLISSVLEQRQVSVFRHLGSRTGVKSETLDMRQYVSPRDQLIQAPKSHLQPHGQLMPLK